MAIEGGASDAEDGDLSDRLTWRSSLDGEIGRLALFSRRLSAGRHTITASVIDSNGVTASSSVEITVVARS